LETARGNPPFGHSVLVEYPTFGTLLVALERHDFHALAEDRGQLSVSELLDVASVIYRRIDDLHGLALEMVGDLLEGPALLVLERALDELLGEAVDLLALLLVLRIDSVQFEA
jgi:phosphate uptake regulator